MRRQTGRIQDRKTWYNALSRYYDQLIDPFQRRIRRSGIQFLDVRPDARILDIGCGTGRGLATLGHAIGANGAVIGIDVAERMCELTRSRLPDDSSSAVICGDALALPFKDESFDSVLVSFTLELFAGDHRRIVLDEIRRVLSPSGQLCVIAPSTTPSHLISSLYKRLNDVVPMVVDSRPLDVSGELGQAGFEIEQTRIERALVVPVEIEVGRLDQPSRRSR